VEGIAALNHYSTTMKIPENLRWLASHPITKRHPARTWFRWVYWQIRQRITHRARIIHFINGTRLAVYPREGLTGYWYVKYPDYEEMTFLAKFLRAGDVFYDAGANAGALSVFAAGLGCKVLAFEPVPETFQRLQENVDLNTPQFSILPLNLALGSTEGKLRMTTSFGTGNHILGPNESAPSVEVEVSTLDLVTKTNPLPTFLKVDVEGHELEVINGAVTLLNSSELVGLMLETFRPHNWKLPKLQELETLLRDHGFFPFEYDPSTNSIILLEHPHEGGNNTLYFRDSEEVQQRLHEHS
jgi:FkbM family methyltransferase